MKLIKYKHNEIEIVWFWVSDNDVALSPQFETKEKAYEWYYMHERWLEHPDIKEEEEWTKE
jgi:hypothetical protein